MNNKSKIIRNSIFVVVLLLIVFVVIFSLNDISEIGNILKECNNKYLLIAGILALLYFFTWALSLYYLMVHFPSKLKRSECFLIASSELFFNGITPFSSGGQPFEVYSMKVGKMKVSDGTSVVMSKMVIYQISIILLSTLALVFSFDKVHNSTDNFIILVFIGYFMNVFVLLFLVLVSTCNWAKKAAMGIVSLFGKNKKLHDKVEKRKESFAKYLEDFQVSFIYLFKHPVKLAVSLFFQIVSLLLMFSIPFFLLKSINYEEFTINYNEFLYVMAISVLNMAFMCWLPTPGASGGAELGFQTLLLSITGINSTIAVSVVLLWRLFTYYLSMVYGFICYLILEKKLKRFEVSEELSLNN